MGSEMCIRDRHSAELQDKAREIGGLQARCGMLEKNKQTLEAKVETMEAASRQEATRGANMANKLQTVREENSELQKRLADAEKRCKTAAQLTASRPIMARVVDSHRDGTATAIAPAAASGRKRPATAATTSVPLAASSSIASFAVTAVEGIDLPPLVPIYDNPTSPSSATTAQASAKRAKTVHAAAAAAAATSSSS